jgi:hypothetical protein
MSYLVNSGDDKLLLVVHYQFLAYNLRLGDKLVCPLNYFKTSRFDVFKMNWSGLKWDRIDNLGERLLFIGENSSSSLCGSTCDVGGCLRNSIYFTDDIFQGFYDKYHDINWDKGIYNLADKTMTLIPRHAQDPHAVWVTPTLR